MQITATEEYSIRFALRLAMSPKNAPLSSTDIAEMESVTLEYTRKILFKMKQSGLLISERGKNGGFTLKGSPDKITLAHIMKSVQNQKDIGYYCEKFESGHKSCALSNSCALRSVWRKVSIAITEVLESCTLSDLIQGERAMDKCFQLPHLDLMNAKKLHKE